MRLSRDGQLLMQKVAESPKPIVVAIHGACVGGGMELALACRYRVASDHPKTILGLPEIQLGLLPGAGGSNRLPRLIGVRAALDIILAGKNERAKKAFTLGMVDELVPESILLDTADRRRRDGWRAAGSRPARDAAWPARSSMARRSADSWCTRRRANRSTRRPVATTRRRSARSRWCAPRSSRG